MPIYEYQCKGCGHKEERLMKMIGKREVSVGCPRCGNRLERKVGKISHFEFKGKLA